MFDWERERDGAVVVVAAGVVAFFAEELSAALAVVQEWGLLVFGVGALALAGVVGYRTWERRSAASTDAPRLVVASWHADGDALSVEALNVGAGTATDLTAVVELGGLEARTPLRPVEGRPTLVPEADGAFECEPVFRGTLDGSDVVGPHSAVVDALREAGLDRLSLEVAVEYATPAGRTARRRVWSSEAVLGESLEETLANSQRAAVAEGLPPE